MWPKEIHSRSELTEQSVGSLPSNSSEEMQRLKKMDPVISKILTFRHAGKPLRRQMLKEDKRVRKLIRDWDRIKEKDGVVNRISKIDGRKVYQLLLPECLQTRVLAMTPGELGHGSAGKTLSLTRCRCCWPGMVSDVESFCRNSQSRSVAKAWKRLYTAMGTILAREPLEVPAVDFTILEPACGYENVLVLTDAFTKFTQAILTKNQTAKTVAYVLVREFVRYGVPKRIHSDQRRNFKFDIVKNFV